MHQTPGSKAIYYKLTHLLAGSCHWVQPPSYCDCLANSRPYWTGVGCMVLSPFSYNDEMGILIAGSGAGGVIMTNKILLICCC